MVEELAVVMAEHAPETAQGGRGDGDSQLGKVALEKRGHVVLAPDVALLFGRCSVGRW